MTYPTEKQLKDLLKLARRAAKEDQKVDNRVKDLVSIFAESQYPIFIEKGMVYHITETASTLFPGIGIMEDISYWVYEVPDLAKKTGRVKCVDKDGKEYDAANLGSYVKFLMSNYE